MSLIKLTSLFVLITLVGTVCAAGSSAPSPTRDVLNGQGSPTTALTPKEPPTPTPAYQYVMSNEQPAEVTDEGSAEVTDWWNATITLLDANDFDGAITELNTANSDDPDNPDILNMLGYAYRAKPNPSSLDLLSSEKYYNHSLIENPSHCGTLEYLGELYLFKGQKDKAIANLETLKTIAACGPETEMLEAEITRYTNEKKEHEMPRAELTGSGSPSSRSMAMTWALPAILLATSLQWARL